MQWACAGAGALVRDSRTRERSGEWAGRERQETVPCPRTTDRGWKGRVVGQDSEGKWSCTVASPLDGRGQVGRKAPPWGEKQLWELDGEGRRRRVGQWNVSQVEQVRA